MNRYSYISLKMVTFASLLLAVTTATNNRAIANPSNIKPDAYLEIHGTVPESIQIGTECIQTYESFRDLVDEIEKKFDAKKFSAAFVAQQKFVRLSAKLRSFREPLAFDLQLRNADPYARFITIRSKFLTTQECGAIAQKIATELRKKEKPRLKLVEQIRKLVDERKWQEAEAIWEKSMASFWQQLAFLEGFMLTEFAKDFYELEEAFKPAREKDRDGILRKAVNEIHQQHRQSRESFFTNLRLASGQLASSGRIESNGKSLTGSASVKRFVIDFGPRHAEIMNDASLDFLAATNNLLSSPSTENSQSAAAAWVKQAELSSKELKEEIISIVNTEAQGSGALSGEDYVEYLRSIAFAMNRFSPETSTDEFKPSLDAIARKLSLDKRVAAYREATSDVLAWRSRIAEQLISKQRENRFPDIDKFTRENLSKNDAGVSLMSPTLAETPVPFLLEPIPKAIQGGWGNVRGKTVSIGEVARFDSDKDLFMSRLRNGTYSRPVGSTRSAEALTSLKRELLVDDAHPPLDLVAAYALYQAESGEVVNAGGEILSLNLEAASTRMLKLPAFAGNFLRYSAIQNSAFPKDELSGLCVRYDLKPNWIATHYQFVRLP
jgi:hypothetical protein